jgi:hypothetical protein
MYSQVSLEFFPSIDVLCESYDSDNYQISEEKRDDE